MGFLHSVGVSNRKVNGFMKLQWHIIAHTFKQTNYFIVRLGGENVTVAAWESAISVCLHSLETPWAAEACLQYMRRAWSHLHTWHGVYLCAQATSHHLCVLYGCFIPLFQSLAKGIDSTRGSVAGGWSVCGVQVSETTSKCLLTGHLQMQRGALPVYNIQYVWCEHM